MTSNTYKNNNYQDDRCKKEITRQGEMKQTDRFIKGYSENVNEIYRS
jgi:hypothetical protein